MNRESEGVGGARGCESGVWLLSGVEGGFGKWFKS